MPKKKTYTITAKLWIYPGEQVNWHFLTVPKKESTEITNTYGSVRRGWGSLPVTVAIKKSVWQTSVFPDKKSGTYLLPVKAKIRTETGIESGDSVRFVLTLR